MTSPKLNDPSLFVGKNYVGGHWIESASRNTFDVHGIITFNFHSIWHF
jgi:succinate-semialdehyde dehydrogenase/glutarate-semialdehyde dehydrogenase